MLGQSEFEDFSSSNPLSAALVSQRMLPQVATAEATSAAAAPTSTTPAPLTARSRRDVAGSVSQINPHSAALASQRKLSAAAAAAATSATAAPAPKMPQPVTPRRGAADDERQSRTQSAPRASKRKMSAAATGAAAAAAKAAPATELSPTPVTPRARFDTATAATVASGRNLSAVQAPLPEGWFVAVDDEGDEYYYTADGLTSTWVRPTDPPPAAAASAAVANSVAAAASTAAAADAAATAAATEDRLPTGWQSALDPSGAVYFYTDDGAITTWERPTAAAPGNVTAALPPSAASAGSTSAARSVRRFSLNVDGEKKDAAAWQEQPM